MNSPTCERCLGPLPTLARADARFCSTRCRVAAHRARQLPAEMTSRRAWTCRDGKRPVTVGGRPASTTDPSTWSDYADVKDKPNGVMLGAGLGCYDLDHCLVGGRLTGEARDLLASVEPIYVEWSMSGDGLHVFVRAREQRGRKRGGVEFYSRARFIAMTGERFA